MKFIVDAQLPKRRCELLTRFGVDCIHTLDLPDENKTADDLIIKIANNEDRIVISKDRDFLQSHLLLNAPEKLLLINTGNIHNNSLIILFEQHFTFILKQFEARNLLIMNRDEIIVHD